MLVFRLLLPMHGYVSIPFLYWGDNCIAVLTVERVLAELNGYGLRSARKTDASPGSVR